MSCAGLGFGRELALAARACFDQPEDFSNRLPAMAAAGGTGTKTYSFKVVLLGEGCVGKTSLVLRYCENKFNDKHITTLQVREPR